MTLQVSLFGMVLAVALGSTLALMCVFGPWPLRWAATPYIEIIRGPPLLIQLLIIRLLSWGYRLLALCHGRAIPIMLCNSAMGFDAVMR